MTRILTSDLAARFADIALGHVSREFPHKLDHVVGGPTDAKRPRDLHPVFFGSFDWHSCVHGYWLLSRISRRWPGLSQTGQTIDLIASRFSTDNIAAECDYRARPETRGFERPYGWAWLLALQAEMHQSLEPRLLAAADRLRPLTELFAERFRTFLPLCSYPVRTGVHSSTAFALRLSADYAERCDQGLFDLMQERCLSWYLKDQGCQAWEPSQDDFLSPALMEAECMRRFLPSDAFPGWFADFLPLVEEGRPASLFAPALVSDRSDGKIAHLDGLNLSRAWCWRSIARALSPGPATEQALAAADRHLEASLPHIAGDYAGEHWLATFATLALETG
jgi:hypothetical protein